jgi:hypothetical protein
MKDSKDYEKYLKSKKIDINTLSKRYSSIQTFNDELSHANVFDKLLNDRIIFLFGEIDDYQSEIIKANILYLDSILTSFVHSFVSLSRVSVFVF